MPELYGRPDRRKYYFIDAVNREFDVKQITFEKEKNIVYSSKINDTRLNEDIFNHISVGDLVYCTMPVTDKALNAIPEGHTTRPFLIVKKGKGQLSANELAGL